VPLGARIKEPKEYISTQPEFVAMLKEGISQERVAVDTCLGTCHEQQLGTD